MRAITLLTTLAVLACTSIAQAQYFNRGFHHNNFHGHHKVVNDVNKVIIEQKVVEFEDSGLRVIGVPINLLELDYYWYYDVHEDKKNQQYRDEVKEELKAELLEEILKNNAPLDKEAIIQEILRDILNRLNTGEGTKPTPTPTPAPMPEDKPEPSPSPTPEPAASTELDDAVLAIFEQSCNKCHSGDKSEVPAWTAPDGTKYPIKTDGNLSEIPQVVGWAIYKSVLGTDPNIKRMPKGGKPLDGDVINTILEWNIQRCK